MRIFLSYASEDREAAALVKQSLAARGHRVFFDRDSLPPGHSYEDRIEAAVGAAELMVFLVSPDSVTPGRFTLTELALAERRWPSADGRVLPVMLRPTPIDALPPYLRPVSLLVPRGNLAAETASAVQALARRYRRWRRPAAVLAAAAVFGAATYAVLAWRDAPQPLVLESAGPVRATRALFDRGETLRVPFRLANLGPASVVVRELTLETAAGAVLARRGPDRTEAGRDDLDLPPGGRVEGSLAVAAAALDQAGDWRICALREQQPKLCAAPASRVASGEPYGADRFAVPPVLARQAVDLAWQGDRYLVLTQSPDRLWSLAEDGTAQELAAFEAPPVSLAVGATGVFVGLGGVRNEVLRLDPDRWTVVARRAIRFPAGLKGAFDEPLALQPTQLALDAERLWVRTGGDSGSAGIAHLDLELAALTVPPWFAAVDFEARDMVLRPGTAVWAARTGTTPSSLYRLDPRRIQTFGGHDHAALSCASDVLPGADVRSAQRADPASVLLVAGCDGELRQLAVNGSAVAELPDFGVLIGHRASPTLWPAALLRADAEGRLVTAVTTRSGPPRGPYTWEASAYAYGDARGATAFFDSEGAQVLQLAAGRRTALLLLHDEAGRRQLVAPGLP